MIERFMILYDNKYLSRKWSYYFSNSNIEEFSYWKTKGGAEKRLQNQIDYYEKRQNEHNDKIDAQRDGYSNNIHGQPDYVFAFQ